MDAEYIKLVVTAILAFLGGYGLKWVEFNRQRSKEKRVELKQELKELHLGLHQALQLFSKFGTDVNEFMHGEKPDLLPMSAIGLFTKPSAELMPKLSSLQRRCAVEGSAEWAAVLSEIEVFFVAGAEAMNGGKFFDLQQSLNRLKQKLATFTLRIEAKIDSTY